MRLVETDALTVTWPEDIDANSKIDIGIVYRGVEGGTDSTEALRHFIGGDLGNGIYVTADKRLAASYGGGPKASLNAGTRVVHAYRLSRALFPEEVIFLFGGAHHGEPILLISGSSIELWHGAWQSSVIEAVLRKLGQIALVIGTPNSIGINQIAVRDRSLLMPLT